MKQPIRIGRFKLMVTLEGDRWRSPCGELIRNPRRAERVAEYFAGRMGK